MQQCVYSFCSPLLGGSLGYQWGGGAQGLQISSPVSTPRSEIPRKVWHLKNVAYGQVSALTALGI